MKKGENFRIHLGDRYYRQNRSKAVPDIYAALVEIITNSDDSYGRLHQIDEGRPDGGDILIEMQRHVGARPSLLIVRDKAEGVTINGMRAKFGTVGGEITAGEGLRGYMARGLKDCTHLGEIRVDSIVDGKHYACRLTRDPAEFWVEEPGAKASDSLRKDLGVGKKNGTKVTLEYDGARPFPQFASVRDLLPLHYALRNIFAEDGPSRVLIRKDENSKPDRLVFPPLRGREVVDEPFTVDGYPEAECRLQIWRAASPLDDKDWRFRRSGILITSGRGIHQCTLFGHDDEFAQRYYGRLECPYIETLLREFDKGGRTKRNPIFLLDPSRRQGLDPQHPFTDALYAHPKARLTKLIEQDRQAHRSQRDDVANDDLRRKFDKAGQLMGRLWKEYVGEEDPTPSEERAFGAARLDGIVVYPPPGFKIGVGETRAVTVYIGGERYKQDRQTRMHVGDEGVIMPLDSFSKRVLKPHPKAPDIVYGSCKIKGVSLGETPIVVRHGKDLRAESMGVVVKTRKEEDWDFNSPLEFEREKRDIPEGETKALRVLGDISKIGGGEKVVIFSSSDDECVTVMGGRHCRLIPRPGFNFAEGVIRIRGSALTDKPATITARLDDWSATVKIRVRPKRNFGGGFKLQLVPNSLGVFRARWKLPDEPNVLEISAVHPSVKPYLGSRDDDWPGQNSPHCQMLLAEIVVEAFCNKLLEGEMHGPRSGSFQFPPDMEPSGVLHTLNLEFHRKVNDLALKVHKILLSPDCFD